MMGGSRDKETRKGKMSEIWNWKELRRGKQSQEVNRGELTKWMGNGNHAKVIEKKKIMKLRNKRERKESEIKLKSRKNKERKWKKNSERKY